MATPDTFQELLDSTEWSKYGYESGNPKCANCMLHSGYEASAVDYTFTVKGILATIRAMLFSRYRDTEASARLTEEGEKPALKVQIDAIAPKPTLTGTQAGGPDGIRGRAFDYRGRRHEGHPRQR